MHGSIFVLLKRFVEAQYDHSTWVKLLEQAKVPRQEYEMQVVYPDEEAYALIQTASDMTGIPVHVLHEKYGEFMVPDLLMVYRKYIQPGWKTLDLIEHTEDTMHAAARKDNEQTAPPYLTVTRISEKELVVDYHSKRKMSRLAIGIIKGIAKYFHETDSIHIHTDSPPDAEQVKIVVKKK
jgi:hypothetical protein